MDASEPSRAAPGASTSLNESTPPAATSGPAAGTISTPLPALLQSGNVPPEFFSHMMTMMQHMSERLLTQQKSAEKVKITDIFLPSYDPDSNVGVREWCKHISTAKSTYNLTDYDIRMKVTSLLKGRAKIWADNWLVTTSSWDELRENIITTFEPENRYSRDVLRFREHSYDSSKDIAEFLSQSWLLWRRLTKDKLEKSDAVEAVIGTVSDERLRIELMNAKAISVPELISVASSIRVKRPSQSNIDQPPLKRPKVTADNRNYPYCTFCKKNGHTFSICRSRNYQNVPSTEKSSATSSTTLPRPTNDKFCSFCSKHGHTFDTCFRREKLVASNVNFVSSDRLSGSK